MAKKIAVIGAGPVGLEAALQAVDRGHVVTLYERGSVGASVQEWGHVRMFSPYLMNTSPLGRRGVSNPPDDDALLTGSEFARLYLQPVADSLGERVRTATKVCALGRAGSRKGDWIGNAERTHRPLQLLIEHKGHQSIETADVVLDCSGTYGQSNGLGESGMPVPGERACADSIFQGVPDVSGAARAAFRGRRVLVVGAGHSAATTVAALARLAETDAELRVDWIIRKPVERPVEKLAGDPLPERAGLAQRVNELAESAPWLRVRAGRVVIGLKREEECIEVQLQPGNESLSVDVIVAATGFRPDLMLARELQVSLCYATEGTLPLAAQLLGETGADCLVVGNMGVDLLRHPEPGYFALGTKSYGRSSNFLIRTGYEQVTAVMDSLEPGS